MPARATRSKNDIGQRFGYRFGGNPIRDDGRLTPFLKDYLEVTG